MFKTAFLTVGFSIGVFSYVKSQRKIRSLEAQNEILKTVLTATRLGYDSWIVNCRCKYEESLGEMKNNLEEMKRLVDKTKTQREDFNKYFEEESN